MPSRLPDILDEALKLGATERAKLVEQIISSFETPELKKIDALWSREAEDRIDAHDHGDIHSTPATVVFDQINQIDS